jgi:hypothetical protein
VGLVLSGADVGPGRRCRAMLSRPPAVDGASAGEAPSYGAAEAATRKPVRSLPPDGSRK